MSQLAQRVQRMADEMRAQQRQRKGRRMQDDEIPIDDAPPDGPADATHETATPDAVPAASEGAKGDMAKKATKARKAPPVRKPRAAKKAAPARPAGAKAKGTKVELASDGARGVVLKALRLFLCDGAPEEQERAQAERLVARLEGCQ